MAAPHGKKNIIAGNWKMNLGVAASRALARGLRSSAEKLSKSEVWVAPSSIALEAVAQELKGSPIHYGAQNIAQEKSGAFTGELSVAMLTEIGCTFSLVGHSERRNVFGEPNSQCVARTIGVLKQGFTVVYCVGETLAERESNITSRVIEEQLVPVLQAISAQEAQNLVIAYEPVWAIGTGKVASTEQIADVHRAIALRVSETLGAGCPVPILYGGSVTAENFASIIQLEHVWGALVGGASLSVEKFAPLIQISEG